MAHIKIRKGLNIPLCGAPSSHLLPCEALADITKHVALDFTPFSPTIHPQLLVNIGSKVSKGEPIIEEKGAGKRRWTAPTAGIVKEIRRGEKRVLESIVIESDRTNQNFPLIKETDPYEFLRKTGLLSHFTMRPYSLPAHPTLRPRSIFVKALESAPFRPTAEMQIQGKENYFQTGIDFLAKLTPGNVHLVCFKDASLFQSVQQARIHTAEGPHPISHPSLHIQLLDPILKSSDIVWTIDLNGVIAIGHALETDTLHPSRIIALAGEGVLSEHRHLYEVPDGCEIGTLLLGRLTNQPSRLISGDPLTGKETSLQGYLGFADTTVCSIPEIAKRIPLHFFRWNSPAYTASSAYSQQAKKEVSTRLHGEERAFIDPAIYDRVMPLQIPTALLVKAILAEDVETAETLGCLEVAPEDFALPTFICPSKIEMVDIVRRGLQKMAAENLSV